MKIQDVPALYKKDSLRVYNGSIVSLSYIYLKISKIHMTTWYFETTRSVQGLEKQKQIELLRKKEITSVIIDQSCQSEK